MNNNMRLVIRLLSDTPFVVYWLVSLALVVSMWYIEMPVRCMMWFGFILSYSTGVMIEHYCKVRQKTIEEIEILDLTEEIK